jgi:hypothetical protein
MSDYQIFINGLAISLEIVGFLLMLRAVKQTKIVEGGQAVPHAMRDVSAPPSPTLNRKGVGLVIAGLAGQIIAMFVP